MKEREKSEMKTCRCGRKFCPKHPRARFCSNHCRNKEFRQNNPGYERRRRMRNRGPENNSTGGQVDLLVDILASDPANIRRVLQHNRTSKRLAKTLKIDEETARLVMSRIRSNASKKKEAKKDELGELIGSQDIIDFGKGRYAYNRVTDKYIFPISGKQPLVMRGEDIRMISAAYSDENGTPATINELAKQYELPKTVVKDVLNRLGRTHDQEALTKEEILTLGTDELIDRLYQHKRAELTHQRDIQDWKRTLDKANKWDKMDVYVMDEFRRLIKDKPYKFKKIPFHKSEKQYAAVLGLSDVHYGKYASEDESYDPYDLEITSMRVLNHVNSLIEALDSFGRPEKIIIPIGSDFFHVDTYDGTTTKGTAQDMAGTPGDIMRGGALLMRQVVDMCREIAPVQLVMLEGNHDRLTGRMLFMYLSALYENCEDVESITGSRPQVFLTYGKNLLGFAHGDGIRKIQALGGLMAMVAPQDWADCPHRTFYTGNFHTEKVEVDEFFSVVKRQMPSLSGTDRWHSVNGYTSTHKSLPMYLHDKENGLMAVFYSNEQVG